MSNEHVWVREHVETFLTGGLAGDERARFESHMTLCTGCSAAMGEAREADETLQAMFAHARPRPGLEDRIIRHVRQAPPPALKFNPKVWGIGMGLAAAVLLGVLGYLISEQGLLETRKTHRVEVAMGESRKNTPSTREATPLTSGTFGLAQPSKQKFQDAAMEIGRLDDPIEYEAKTADHNESADNFKARKGDMDFTSDKAFKGLGTYDTIGGGRAGGAYAQRLEANRSIARAGEEEPQPEASGWALEQSPPSDAGVKSEMAQGQRGQQKASGEEGYYSYRDDLTKSASAPAVKYFKPGEAENSLAKAKEMDKRNKNKGGKDEELAAAKKSPSVSEPDSEESGKKKAQADGQDPKQTPPAMQRKIIRNGEMEFEVDSFDASYDRIQKIAAEESGFIASTNSEKLSNGKVRGSIVVRCPPENLDRLVQKLRALGELKGQKITSQDITKHYTDLESALRAARAMEERLINIIKNGGSDIKALVEAEKQLGVYRERIEQLEGEIRYYNSMISLSTLTISLFEKDIKTPTSAKEFETVEMGIETDEVEKAYTDAVNEINGQKGRVTRAELKKFEAGQYSAQISFEIAPLNKDQKDQVGPLIERFKQFGRTSRLERNRSQTTEGGSGRPQGIAIERKDTVFNIHIYNLANISPRETVHLSIACADVEKAYDAVLKRIEKAGGRVITSNLNRQKPEQANGTVNFEIKSAEAGAVEFDVRAAGEVMRSLVTENPDTQNVTKAKRGFSVSLFHIATVPPHETVIASLACADVEASFNTITALVKKAGGRIIVSNLNRSKGDRTSATIHFEAGTAEGAADVIDKEMSKEGDVVHRQLREQPEGQTSTKAKKRFNVDLLGMGQVQARETTTMKLATRNVGESYRTLLGAVLDAKGRVTQSRLDESDKYNITGVLVFEVRRDDIVKIEDLIAKQGDTFSRNVIRAGESEYVVDSKVGIAIELVNADRMAPREEITLKIEVPDVDRAFSDIRGLAMNNGGREIVADRNREPNGQITGKLTVDVALTGRDMMRTALDGIEGRIIRAENSRKNPKVPDGSLARARFELTFVNAEAILSQDEGVNATIRSGLSTSLKGLMWSLQFVVIGLCFVVPWMLIVWPVWRVIKRRRAKAESVVAAAEPPKQ